MTAERCSGCVRIRHDRLTTVEMSAAAAAAAAIGPLTGHWPGTQDSAWSGTIWHFDLVDNCYQSVISCSKIVSSISYAGP